MLDTNPVATARRSSKISARTECNHNFREGSISGREIMRDSYICRNFSV